MKAQNLETALISGDLSVLTPEERVALYNKVCETTGLNPVSRPFDYIKLNGKLTLYARKDATDQLRKLHGVSVATRTEVLGDAYFVYAIATDKSGRTDSDVGAVSIANLKGDALANAIMKAHTKAKRRVTLSICGLGFLDATELETIPGVVPPLPEEFFPVSEPQPQLAPAEEQPVQEFWLAWQSTEDAIVWAGQQLPDWDLEQIKAEFGAHTKGRKAWVAKVNELKAAN